MIDTPDATEAWKNYIARMKQLTQPNSALTSRVRFMVMDVLECGTGLARLQQECPKDIG